MGAALENSHNKHLTDKIVRNHEKDFEFLEDKYAAEEKVLE